MAIRRSIKEMWLGATLSTLLHVDSIVLIFIGLPVVALALSTDRKEPETVDTNTPAGARKVEAPAKKSKNIEVARETAEGQKTEEKPTEDPSQSAPSIDIQIISATTVPSILQKIIEKLTTAINKSQQPQPDKKKPTPASKTVKKPTPALKAVETSTDQEKAQFLLGYLALKPGRSRDLAQADAMFWAAAQQGRKFSAAARKPLQRIMRAS
jgi:FtsZ-interacting cell division protein ZipA